MKKLALCLFTFSSLFFLLGTAAAFDFTGTAMYLNGSAASNVNASVTSYLFSGGAPTVIAVNSTMSDSSGAFTVAGILANTSYSYKLTLVLRGANSDGSVTLIGPSLPEFPYAAFTGLSNPTIYLRNATTINITRVSAINQTMNEVTAPFYYQIKDQSFGFPLLYNFNTYVNSIDLIVPTGRSYSIMIYPNQSMPVSVDVTAASIAGNYSTSLNRSLISTAVNASLAMKSVSGYIKDEGGAASFANMTIVPYLLEAGNMVFEEGTLPLNMSQFLGGTDIFDTSTGFYNITLPGTATASNILLVAYSDKSAVYYAGFKNISLGWGASPVTQFNITVKPLAGSLTSFVVGNGPTAKNISTYKKKINIINSSSSLITSLSTHIEAKLVYGGFTFTWMVDSDQNGYVELPLWNTTGISELSVYSQQGAPRELDYTAAEVLGAAAINITQTNMDMRTPTGTALTGLSVYVYMSNATCDVPAPPAACILSSATEADFNPLNAVISGAPISFRIVYNGIYVHYTNADLLASGPPDAAFDSAANTAGTNGTAHTFANLWRFGSLGPDIYDEVMIGTPYTTLNETQTIKISIPYLYDDDWNISWTNGVNTTAELPSAYSDFNSGIYASLVNRTNATCSTSNESAVCYVDTTNDRIWMRIPHFSGTGMDVDGTALCTESWSCTSWSTCSSNSQTRTCTDVNACGTTEERPVQSKSCTSTTTGTGESTTNNSDATLSTISYSWSTVAADSEKTYLIANNNIKLTSIKFTLDESSTNVRLTVEGVTSKPTSISKPSGAVYSYVKISSENIGSKLDTAKIGFKVAKSWLQTNGVGLSTIKLLRYNNDKWDELTTTRDDSDSNYYYFESATPGFSYFAITGVSTTTASTETGTTGTTEETEIQSLSSAATAKKSNGFSFSGKLWINYLAYSGLMACVAVVLLFYLNIEGKLEGMKVAFQRRKTLPRKAGAKGRTQNRALFSLSRRPQLFGGMNKGLDKFSRRLKAWDIKSDFNKATRKIERKKISGKNRPSVSLRRYGYRVKARKKQ